VNSFVFFKGFYAEQSQINRDFTGNDEYVRENLQNDEMIPVSDKIKFVNIKKIEEKTFILYSG